jgi:hypothetical protein
MGVPELRAFLHGIGESRGRTGTHQVRGAVLEAAVGTGPEEDRDAVAGFAHPSPRHRNDERHDKA